MLVLAVWCKVHHDESVHHIGFDTPHCLSCRGTLGCCGLLGTCDYVADNRLDRLLAVAGYVGSYPQ